MTLLLPFSVAFLVSLQQVDGHSAKKGKDEIAEQINCIYYNMEYVNCTWEQKKEAANGVNDTFYYWCSSSRLHKELCNLNKENQSCSLKKKKKTHKWLWLYIKTLKNFTLLAPNGFQLQGRGPHRLINQKTNTSDLNCTYYDNGNLNCTRAQDSSYKIYYTFSKTALHVKQCNKYLENRSLNFGCQLTEDPKFCKSHWLSVYVIDSNHFTVVEPHGLMLLENVKLSPPQNLSARLTAKEEVSLTWDVPKNQKPEWLQYEMGWKSNMDSDWQGEEFRSHPFTLPNADLAKCYFFRLRSRMNDMYAKKSYWSEWGPTLIWKGKTCADSSASPTINLLFLVLPLAAVLSIVLLTCALYKIKRVNTWLFPGIPDPKHSFVELFEDYNGNFQEWISVSKCLNINSQSDCIPIECQVEEEAVRLKMEHEDPQRLLSDKTERSDSAPEGINEENEKSVEDVPNSQLLVHETSTIDMSKVIMDKNMYIRL
ncbi:cytokine receptor common subunit gamma-like [Cetorhinus maximus]